VTKGTVQPFVEESPGEAPVRGFLHRAPDLSGDFLVLTHGAGGNCNSPLLVAVAERLVESGINALRCDLPYRQRRPTGPPSPPDAKHDQEGLRRAVTLMKQQFAGHAFLGGSSYGGRQASMLVASDPSLVQGLLLLSYPLHPPGKPGQLRTAHFPELRVPCLFISGTRDAFGSIEELQAAIKLIPAKSKLIAIDGAAHGLWQKSNRETLPQTIAQDFRSFFV
jgi:predicted alpha/beta-hydrolase family hydrolase